MKEYGLRPYVYIVCLYLLEVTAHVVFHTPRYQLVVPGLVWSSLTWPFTWLWGAWMSHWLSASLIVRGYGAGGICGAVVASMVLCLSAHYFVDASRWASVGCAACSVVLLGWWYAWTLAESCGTLLVMYLVYISVQGTKDNRT